MIRERLPTMISVAGLVISGVAVTAADQTSGNVTVDVGPVRKGSWGDYPKHEGHAKWSRPFTIRSGAEAFSLRYTCCCDKSHLPEVATPEGYIGMPGPCGANWYSNGFLYIIVNGKDIGRTPLTAIRKGAGGKQGTVALVWERADVAVHATFLMRTDDPTLYLEVAAFPKKSLKTIAVHMVAYPIAYVSNADRWVITPTRGIRQPKTRAIDPAKESWLLVQDHKLSGKGKGGCGVAFLPSEIGKGKAGVGVYGVKIELESKPGTRRVHLAIWDFYNKSDARARAYVESSIQAVHKRLATLDFSNPLLKPAYWAKRRPELVGMLDKIKKQTKLSRPVRRQVETIDKLHVRMAQQQAKGQRLSVADEQALLDALGTIESAYWDLRLAALFAGD